MTEPRIENLLQTQLVGKHVNMSMENNRTGELWRSFMPERKLISNLADENFYSVEVYPDLQYFANFNPAAEFQKWAAVKVIDDSEVPESMESLVIPEGLYAVFAFKGIPANVPQFMQYVFGTWMPASEYELDHRPHFALMGEKYKNNDPESEEEFWIPISPK
ncbi:MAG: GyrI-like domain-containing protein [Cytophagia bacterium]|nr:GyrI-like domain-containing protein [Cytophagia bacterium]